MKLGLLSDTHGHSDLVDSAAEIFAEDNVDALIHAGDVTQVQHIQSVLDLDVPLHLVYGNCDFNQEAFRQAEAHTTLTAHGKSALLEYEDKVLGVTHGHHDRMFDQLRSEHPDYIIHGHTHERRDEVQGEIRYVNPGSVKPSNSSIGLLNPREDSLTFVDLNN